MHQIVSGDDQVHEIQNEISDSVLSFNTLPAPGRVATIYHLGQLNELRPLLQAAPPMAQSLATGLVHNLLTL